MSLYLEKVKVSYTAVYDYAVNILSCSLQA